MHRVAGSGNLEEGTHHGPPHDDGADYEHEMLQDMDSMRLERGVVEGGKVPHGKNETGDGKRLHGTGEPTCRGQYVRLWRKSGLISQ